MVPSLLSVFTFYIIAAIAPADAKLQPRAVRQVEKEEQRGRVKVSGVVVLWSLVVHP